MSNPFLRQRAAAVSEGVRIVRNILSKNHFPEGFTTKQMFELAVQEPVPPGFKPYPLAEKLLQIPTPKALKDKYGPQKPACSVPPHPDHPVRSIAFLKKDILRALRGSNEIKMVSEPKSSPIPLPTSSKLTKRERKLVRTSTTSWVWKCIPPEERPTPPPPKPEKFVFGREVGVGLDTSHLSKRRQAARVGKVSRAVDKMKNHQQRLELFKRDEWHQSRGPPDLKCRRTSKAVAAARDTQINYGIRKGL